MSRRVIVLIGDIQDSRRIAGRDAFNAALQKALDAMNKDRRGLLSPYTHTIGDEIQAVFSSPEELFADACYLLAVLQPVRMRFSFGVGSLSTRVNPRQALGMDGPAFHTARSGIDRLRKSGLLFGVSDDAGRLPGLLQPSLDLVSHTMAKWKPTRLGSLTLLLRDRKPKEIAGSLKRSEKTIYKTISTGGLEIIRRVLLESESAMGASLRETHHA